MTGMQLVHYMCHKIAKWLEYWPGIERFQSSAIVLILIYILQSTQLHMHNEELLLTGEAVIICTVKKPGEICDIVTITKNCRDVHYLPQISPLIFFSVRLL